MRYFGKDIAISIVTTLAILTITGNLLNIKLLLGLFIFAVLALILLQIRIIRHSRPRDAYESQREYWNSIIDESQEFANALMRRSAALLLALLILVRKSVV